MKTYNPAQEGIDAAINDANKREFIKKICDEFKSFCLASVKDSKEFEDHLDFLRAQMDVFIDFKNEEE